MKISAFSDVSSFIAKQLRTVNDDIPAGKVIYVRSSTSVVLPSDSGKPNQGRNAYCPPKQFLRPFYGVSLSSFHAVGSFFSAFHSCRAFGICLLRYAISPGSLVGRASVARMSFLRGIRSSRPLITWDFSRITKLCPLDRETSRLVMGWTFGEVQIRRWIWRFGKLGDSDQYFKSQMILTTVDIWFRHVVSICTAGVKITFFTNISAYAYPKIFEMQWKRLPLLSTRDI